MSVPSWLEDAVFYQIFPDRFYRGSTDQSSMDYQAWGSEPTANGFMGGNLKGIISKIDYLLDLGINAIYLNPIFASAANHRYHINDYFKIDPRLGTLDDFKALIDVAHENNIKIILDGVFNHTGRGFFAFKDVLENEERSRYLDWYHIKGFPLDAFGEGKAKSYLAWWGIKDLPKLNTDTIAVRKYLMDVARYWIELGADGWRLDVPSEIDDDSFWKGFRDVVKSVNPEAYTVGEIWELDTRWVGGDHFDGLMHYPLRTAIIELLSEKISMVKFADKIENFLQEYPTENIYGMYLPLGTHDTQRILSKLDGSVEKVKLASLIQFSYPGVPAIYYGDEVGVNGGKDPENRKAFPWDEKEWDHELQEYIKKLISLRKNSAALKRGSFERIYIEEDGHVYAYARNSGDECLLILINASDEDQGFKVPVEKLSWHNGDLVEDLIDKSNYGIKDSSIEGSLGPWTGIILSKV